MDACFLSIIGRKTQAEKPYCSDGGLNKSKNEMTVLTGFCGLSNCSKRTQNKEKYVAHLKKPNIKEEIVILICIIKKGIKVLCRYSQNHNIGKCPKPDYNIIYYFIDISKRLDRFKKKFLKIYSQQNNMCCYSKLVKELKLINECLMNEIQRNFNIYKCKMDLISCINACFRSAENKIYSLMAKSDDASEFNFNEQLSSGTRCDSLSGVKESLNNSSSKKSFSSFGCQSKNNVLKSILSLKSDLSKKCDVKKESSQCSSKYSLVKKIEAKCDKIEDKPAIKDKCCFDENKQITDERNICDKETAVINKCDKKDETEVNNSIGRGQTEIFDMTLEYCKYSLNENESSSDENEIDSFEQELPNGFIKSKIYKKDDTINLTVKCITNGKSAILDLEKEAKYSEKSDKLLNIANNMAKLLCMSKQWYDSGREVYRQLLNKC